MGAKIAVVIMAAGKGTRMKTDLPKVLVELKGRPLLSYVLDTANAAGPEKIVLIVGYGREKVIEAFEGSGVEFAIQEPQLGTAHAIMMAKDTLRGFDGDVVILSGDVPLIKPDTIKKLVKKRLDTSAAITILTIKLDDAGSYGRIIRDGDAIVDLVEAKDATDEQLTVNEINSGVYSFDSTFLFNALDLIDNKNAQGEYYLTDLVKIAVEEGRLVNGVESDDPKEALGLNTVDEVAAMENLIG